MLKLYVKGQGLLARLRSNEDGVVSFEYVIVAACIIVAVAAAFGTDAQTGIGLALTTAINKMVALLPASLKG
jgi:Flp pilus assembly pilin Flp